MLSQLFKKCAYEIKYEQVGDSVNYAFVEDKETLYIYFQGSNSITDWVLNFWFTKRLYKMFKVHRGFYKAYSQVRNIVLDKIFELKEDKINFKFNKVYVIGYSHGGALCQLAVEDIVYHRPEIDINGYAFESPRCLKVPKRYRWLWKKLTVIRTNNDLITHLPPKLFGFTDLGKMLKVKGDTTLVKKCIPNCIKSHYPEVVLNALTNYELDQLIGAILLAHK